MADGSPACDAPDRSGGLTLVDARLANRIVDQAVARYIAACRRRVPDFVPEKLRNIEVHDIGRGALRTTHLTRELRLLVKAVEPLCNLRIRGCNGEGLGMRLTVHGKTAAQQTPRGIPVVGF